MDVSSFITFGCWNKKGEALDSVMKELQKYDNVNTILVSGDNYYSDEWVPTDEDNISVGGGGKKEKKEKKLNYQDLRSGFEGLYGLNKNIHIGIGNHDIKSVYYIENNGKGEIYLSHEGGGFNDIMEKYNKKGGYLTKAFEEDICRELNKGDERLYTYFEDGQEEIKGMGTKDDLKIVFINTNGKEEKGKEKIILRPLNKDNPPVVDSPPADGSPSSPMKKKIVIVGHIPFLYLSRKRKKDFVLGEFIIRKELADDIVGLGSIYDEIYYLCADEHYYMGMEIEYGGKLIHQHIVGTGGTILDQDIDEAWNIFKVGKENTILSSKGESPAIIVKPINPPVVKHGFCHCTLSGNEIQINFIPVPEPEFSVYESVGGYMKKRKYKKRSKKSKRKSNKRSKRSKRKYKKRSKRKYKKRSQRSKRKSKKR